MPPVVSYQSIETCLPQTTTTEASLEEDDYDSSSSYCKTDSQKKKKKKKKPNNDDDVVVRFYNLNMPLSSPSCAGWNINKSSCDKSRSWTVVVIISGILLLFAIIRVSIRTQNEQEICCNNPPYEPNPPNWPTTVRIFHPNDDSVDIVDTIASLTANLTDRTTGHFSNERFAFLFLPGNYTLTNPFEVGYYVQILGLGLNTTQVELNGGPICHAMDLREDGAGSLDTFWRSIENVRLADNLVWAVSQASPIRRLLIDGNLNLFQGYCFSDKCGAYYASGGYMANVVVRGQVNFGSQQQFFSRHTNFWADTNGGAWNLVFVGCNSSHELNETKKGIDGPDLVRSKEDVPRVRTEKPFIAAVAVNGTSDSDSDESQSSSSFRFKLVVPKTRVLLEGGDNNPLKQNQHQFLVGARLSTHKDDDIRDFSKVRLVRPDDSSQWESIQNALDRGLDIVFSPGIYRLGQTLTIRRAGTVVLGLGMATIIAPNDGTPIFHVAPRIANVRVAGFILEATVLPAKHFPNSTLLIWGSPGVADPGDAMFPGVLSDIFCRTGGSTTDARNASVDIMIQLFSGNFVGDYLWLWRPDHLALQSGEEGGGITGHYAVQRGECRSQTGLQVWGNDVTLYGLSVEHHTGNLVDWHGDRGQVRFYQSELPYDVTQHDVYGGDGQDSEYVSYHVRPHVRSHDLLGGGVYSYFRDHNVSVTMAFRHPASAANNNINMTNVFTRFLNGKGSIESVVNGVGDAVTTNHRMSRVAFESGGKV